MPEYSYCCDPQQGGCGYTFSVVQSFSQYKVLKRCPKCKKHKLIRDYSEDNVTGSVKGSGGARTIGQLAEKNSSRMSSDQKEVLNKKQHHLKHMHEDIDKLHIKMDRFLYWLLGGLGAIFLSLLEEENLTSILDLLENDIPVSEITSVLLLTGFSKGQYSPDLLMMLIEPVMYMIMAIAD